jgi:hypothetical protein
MAESATFAVPDRARGRLVARDDAELARLLRLLTDADTVELKVTVPESDRRPVLTALGADPLDAQIRQVGFFDTPDLRLHAAGLILRVRRTHDRPADVVVKLRPVDPATLPDDVRRLPGLEVEVDASPAGFLCSCSIKKERPDARVKELMGGRTNAMDALGQGQRKLLEQSAARDIRREDLRVFGPIHVLKRKFVPEGQSRRLVAEMWFLPDGTQILELSTRCDPSAAFQVAAETRAFLAAHGVDLDATQDTKTRSAITALAAGPQDAP